MRQSALWKETPAFILPDLLATQQRRSEPIWLQNMGRNTAAGPNLSEIEQSA